MIRIVYFLCLIGAVSCSVLYGAESTAKDSTCVPTKIFEMWDDLEVSVWAQSPEPPTAEAPDISIHKAATFGNIEAVKQHLAAGTEVDAKDDNGFPPLHLAADRGHTEVVELLITKGAEVNAQSDGGNTPLDWAVDSAHSDEETADLLRKHGGKTGEELKAEEKLNKY